MTNSQKRSRASLKTRGITKMKKNEAHKSCTNRTITDDYQRGKVMTPRELYTTKRQNICVDSVTYVCGVDAKEVKHYKEMTIIKKTYFCGIVRETSGNADNVWMPKTSYRSKVHTGCKKCYRKMHGYFTKNEYWLEQHAPHACQRICGASETSTNAHH